MEKTAEAKAQPPERPAPRPSIYVDISETLSFWIIVLAISLIISVILADTDAVQTGTSQYAFLHSLSQFVLFGAGIFILPLITGAVIGIDVGHKARSIAHALKACLINSIYCALIYMIAVIVLYEIMLYALPHVAFTLNMLLINWITLPIVIFIVVAEILALISISRRL